MSKNEISVRLTSYDFYRHFRSLHSLKRTPYFCRFKRTHLWVIRLNGVIFCSIQSDLLTCSFVAQDLLGTLWVCFSQPIEKYAVVDRVWTRGHGFLYHCLNRETTEFATLKSNTHQRWGNTEHIEIQKGKFICISNFSFITQY